MLPSMIGNCNWCKELFEEIAREKRYNEHGMTVQTAIVDPNRKAKQSTSLSAPPPVKITVNAYALKDQRTGQLLTARKGNPFPSLFPNLNNVVNDPRLEYVKVLVTVEEVAMTEAEKKLGERNVIIPGLDG